MLIQLQPLCRVPILRQQFIGIMLDLAHAIRDWPSSIIGQPIGCAVLHYRRLEYFSNRSN